MCFTGHAANRRGEKKDAASCAVKEESWLFREAEAERKGKIHQEQTAIGKSGGETEFRKRRQG